MAEQLRLIGLVLFITSIFLAMAALATHTTHIRFKRPTRGADGRVESPLRSDAPSRDEFASSVQPTRELQFFSVPVAYPLLASGVLGLLMWFSLAPSLSSPSPKRKRRRRRK